MRGCMGIAKRYRFMKYPCLMVTALILSVCYLVYYIGKYFVTNGRRYVGIAFALLFFVSSCSFSFAVLTGEAGFIDTQETYSASVEDSDVALAIEQDITPDESILETEPLKEYESSEDIENAGFYTLDEILEDAETYAIGEQDEMDGVVGKNPEGESELVFDSGDWRLILVNKQHPIPDDYVFELGTIKGGMKCDERILPDLFAMLQAAKDEGINLNIASPYRTDDRQESNFNKKIKMYMEQGYSYMEAYKTASRVVTIPGASEHQIGLALDITSDIYTKLEEGFGETEAGMWLAEHSCEYGFIIRYPEGKEYITSIEYEPWHFRYVGKEAAAIMKKDNICLEEFWDKYL